ncbi:hypothetical protein HY992_05445 [Candidatus Micrarchaeota archaeon]|nr:hypothetical protein [Candidatus Micrarchaeota archaeon]
MSVESKKVFYGVGVVVVVLLLVVSVFLLVGGMRGALQVGVETPEFKPVELNSFAKCAGRKNVSADSAVFYFSDDCDACVGAKLVVRKLEGEGFKFFWADSSRVESKLLVASCFYDSVTGTLPEFFCAGTGKVKSGELSEGELRAFAQACRQNATA